jgi:hypothetical protein
MESKPDVPMQIGCQEKKTLAAARSILVGYHDKLDMSRSKNINSFHDVQLYCPRHPAIVLLTENN